MTTTTTATTTTHPESAATGMSAAAQADAAARAGCLPDMRAELQTALDLAVSTARAVRHDQLTLPTPCVDYDVDGLIRHLAGAADRSVVAAAGGTVPELPPYDDVAIAAIVDLLATTAAAFGPAWADDATLDQTVSLPWAVLPARVLVAIYLSEISTHTWDLAVATGQQPAFDDHAVEIALATMRTGLPAEPRDQVPFGPVQAVADDAPAIERLVAWCGRIPTWPA
jgi:uncharacterized protein (TIGR03086 family)